MWFELCKQPIARPSLLRHHDGKWAKLLNRMKYIHLTSHTRSLRKVDGNYMLLCITVCYDAAMAVGDSLTTSPWQAELMAAGGAMQVNLKVIE
jgi:hypothetical protein